MGFQYEITCDCCGFVWKAANLPNELHGYRWKILCGDCESVKARAESEIDTDLMQRIRELRGIGESRS